MTFGDGQIIISNHHGTRPLSTGTAAYEQWLREQEVTNSALTKMQRQFWVTKQTVYKKLGKKEDDCVVASDSELDAKLELFRSIHQSCADLQRIIERYQEKLCTVSQEENAMGRFLKEAGRTDKTRAGKMMTSAGKALSYCGQQRLTLRMPLLRLHQEVDTFRRRAIEDTQQNVTAMEKSRTEYRASLSWMKEVSQQLDPDTNKQMERFRKVQTQVRRSKVRFDQQKLDCLQKVDLLAAARCNMFSHALILYQNQLLAFAQNASKTFSSIASSFSGYQHYEFSVVKELAETSLKLAEETGVPAEEQQQADKDQLLFFESDYRDAAPSADPKEEEEDQKVLDAEQEMQEVLLDLGLSSSDLPSMPEQELSSDTSKLLEDLFSTPENPSSGFGAEWQAAFGTSDSTLLPSLLESDSDSFLPSRLLDTWCQGASATDPLLENFNSLNLQPSQSKPSAAAPSVLDPPKKASAKDLAAWFNVFADLDPLANPDAVGKREHEEQRNC